MGFWDVIYPIGDRIKEIAPTMKSAGDAAYHCTADAVNKINQVIGVEEGIKKLPQYLPDEETRALISLYTSTLARNTVKEGIKLVPGGTMATKILSDTILEVKQERHKDGMKAKGDRLQEELGKSTPQPDALTQMRRPKM